MFPPQRRTDSEEVALEYPGDSRNPRIRPLWLKHEHCLVAPVRLDAGVEVVSKLATSDPAAIRIRGRGEPYWLAPEDRAHLLLFEPDG